MTTCRSGPVEEDSLQAEYASIDDYAVIGDCRSAALVSRSGSIDWLCMPRFDGPSVFAAILDSRAGGRFRVAPVDDATVSRRYLGDTNVLETTFETSTGRVRLVDAMPVAGEAEKRRRLWASHEVVRLVECLEGNVEVEVEYEPRPDYARTVPRLRDRGAMGLWCQHRGEALAVRSEIPLELTDDRSGARGRTALAEGERRFLSLVYAYREPAVVPPLGEDAAARLEASLRWWRRWARRGRYQGRYRDAVVRSGLVLKLMTFSPSGALVAAPTTSLPEHVGGERNWDYRYCWLRDASLTLEAFLNLGHKTQALAFHSWAMHATRRVWPQLNVLYDVYGRSTVRETELDHLEGYRGSRPVRVGNAAEHQLQLDIYGEVLDAVWQFVHRGGSVDRTTAKRLVGLGETVCKRWREPDEGIWEIRGERCHHTFSKAMCWVALDRLLRLAREGHLRAPVERFEREASRIRDEVERRGWSEELGSYVVRFDGAELDASLLLLARYGYAAADDPRMRSTCERVQERLGVDGLLYRYSDPGYDGLSGQEGAFVICGFWGVECLARRGELEEAVRRFEHLLSFANDVGLLAEEIDPDSGTALGNFPQALSHIGVINAAACISECAGGQPAAIEPATPEEAPR